jgi:hypothetical protein
MISRRVRENMDDATIGLAGPDRLDALRDLWLAMHHHHQDVATLQPLAADDEDLVAETPDALLKLATG